MSNCQMSAVHESLNESQIIHEAHNVSRKTGEESMMTQVTEWLVADESADTYVPHCPKCGAVEHSFQTGQGKNRRMVDVTCPDEVAVLRDQTTPKKFLGITNMQWCAREACRLGGEVVVDPETKRVAVYRDMAGQQQ